ncbi:MAG: hypothetical protein IPK16_30795 [Anaerolineales bacterium]|nr:hypothetical protein [Anaerolineales bacterium]
MQWRQWSISFHARFVLLLTVIATSAIIMLAENSVKAQSNPRPIWFRQAYGACILCRLSIQVSWEVKNEGSGATNNAYNGGWYDVLYFSTDNVFDDQDQALNSIWHDTPD